MNPETGCYGKAPVQFLLLRTEVPGRFGHRDDLRPIYSVRSPMVHDGRLPACDNVLHPIGAFAIWEGNEKVLVVFDGKDRGLVLPTRTASNMTDDRSAGLLFPR